MQIAGRSKSIPCLISIACLGLFSAVNAQVSPFIYGIHDHDTNIQEYLDHFSAGGVTGWVTATIAIGSNPNDTGGDDFRWIANQGHSVIVRLNNGYCGTGNIPTPDKYDDFAQRAAHYVAATQGADIFIIGNETNLAVEWPPVNGHAQYVSPQDYASLFRKTYDAIKAVRPGAQVITQALAPFAGPFSAGSTCGFTHDANPLNWVQYMNQMLTEIKSTGGIDGIALHINSRGYTYNDIHSTQKVNAGAGSVLQLLRLQGLGGSRHSRGPVSLAALRHRVERYLLLVGRASGKPRFSLRARMDAGSLRRNRSLQPAGSDKRKARVPSGEHVPLVCLV